MRFKHLLGSLFASALVALGASSAWAQDYTVSSATNQWVTPPATAVNLSITGDDSSYLMSSNTAWNSAAFPPFPISFYGRSFTTAAQFGIMTNGYMQLGGTTSSGCCSPSAGPFASGNTYDGIIAPAWTDLHSGTGAGNAVKAWVDGTAPNRRFIVAWTNWSTYGSQANGTLNFQIQFYELTSANPGRIVMAYTGGWTAGGSFGVMIDEYQGSGRYVRPPAPGTSSGLYTFASTPPNDWVFDPKVTSFKGQLLYDQLVSDASGIGNTFNPNVPLSGLNVELRDATNATAGLGTTDASGNFTIKGIALVGTTVGSIAVVAESPACMVRTVSGGAKYAFTLATGVSFAADKDVGIYTITNGLDPNGVARAPLNIARTANEVLTWCSTRTKDTIPQCEALYDTTSSLGSSYTKAGTGLAQMRISGASANSDAWDLGIIRKTYARHVLASISAQPTATFDGTFDLATSDENAFAEGFGYYLNTVVSGASNLFYDGINGTTATRIDLESPTLTSAKGSNVAGWLAAALYDLTDPANEAWDTVNGTGTAAENVFKTVDSLKVPPTAGTFYSAWGPLGYGGGPLPTLFIYHGMIPDDSDEANDSAATAKKLTQFGFVRSARVLSLYNEDWYEFIMPQPTNKMTAVVVYDRVTYGTMLAELRTEANSVVGTLTGSSSTSPLQFVSGPLPAGTYRVRVAHTGGSSIPVYSVSAFSELAFSASDFQPWTVGHAYNVPVNVKGGIPPYFLSVEQPFVKPPGLILDGANAKVTGVPSIAGLYNFVLSAKDSGVPQSVASGPQSFRVNPELKLQFGEFLAFAHDKPLDREAAYEGGTAPYTFSVTQGVLPPGVSAKPGELGFTGTAVTTGSYPLEVAALDVAGSGDKLQMTAVVCDEPGVTLTLPLGAAATGFYFDAVQGTKASLGIKTLKGQTKRALRVQVLNVDGSAVLDLKTKGGKGAGSAAGFIAPATGRYYFVAASDTGDASQLIGTAKIAPPTSGKGSYLDHNFVAGKTFSAEVGALAGAQMTFVAKPDNSGLGLRALYLLDPAGTIVAFAPGEVVEKGGSVTVKRTLNVSGTWQVVLGAKPGNQGHFTYAFKLVEPKGVVFSAD